MTSKIRITKATDAHRIDIDQLRHEIYAEELRQFSTESSGTLHDRSNVESIYLTAFENDKLIGFVGITSPESTAYSIDHYISRGDVPVPFDDHLFEIRALSVINSSRGSMVAAILMYAAFRWIQSQGGKQLVAIGHQKVKPMYLRLGMLPTGNRFICGNLEYELLTAPLSNIEAELTRFNSRLTRLEAQVEWMLDIPFRKPTECYHGGAFFEAVGNRFDSLARRNEVINADVLDAWFPPCPEALQELHEHLGWIVRTSPPNHAEGLTHAIAEARGVRPDNILSGGGSSPLIFLAFRHWLKPSSKVLLLNPTYGEYAHVLEKVIGCQVERLTLSRKNGYSLETGQLSEKINEGFDQVIWVNPNSPTGRHVRRSEVEKVLEKCPERTRIWIDETYIEYAGQRQSLESAAARKNNVVVVKSMSKVYGLSGLRVGYLCGTAKTLSPLRGLTPPWSVSLPAQVAAIKALENPAYYAERYKETHRLRAQFILGLNKLGISEIVPGIANFVLFHLADSAPDGETVIARCREQGLFIRDASEMGTGMGKRAIRIAVKDADTNLRILHTLGCALENDKQLELQHD